MMLRNTSFSYVYSTVLSIVILEKESYGKHWWSKGRMVACHAVDPGSSPGQCKSFCFSFLFGDCLFVKRKEKKSKEWKIGNWCQSKIKKKRISFLCVFSLLFVFLHDCFLHFTGFLCASFLPTFGVLFIINTHSLCFCPK